MEMNLVNKVNVFGSKVKYNVKHNAGKYMVVLGLGTLSLMTVLTSCTSSPQDVTPQEITYTQEQADEIAEKAVITYQENQKVEADKTQLETDFKTLETTVTDGFAKIPEQLDDALKKHSEEQESEDVYVPSRTWYHNGTSGTRHGHDGSDARHQHNISNRGYSSTPFRAGSVGEVEDAVRYYSTIGAFKNIRKKSGFQNIFGYVPSAWVNGISSSSDRELKSDNAFYINEEQGIAIFYFRDGGKHTHNISATRAEDFVVNHLWNNPSDINKFTIVEAGPHYK